MNKENCALKLVDEIILYYDARPKKTSKQRNYDMQFLDSGATCTTSLVSKSAQFVVLKNT